MKRKFLSLGAALIVLCLSATAGAAQTFSNAFAGFGSNDSEPIEIEASELQVEDKSSIATFVGDVVVVQGDTSLRTQRLRVFYDGSGAQTGGDAVQQRISRLEAAGSVHIQSADQMAQGDAASFDMNKQIMVMTGKEVVLSQGPNVVVGNRLTINLKTGKADLQAPSTGRVKVLIQPNSLDNN